MVGALLTGGPMAAVDPPGTLRVHVVDSAGAPIRGVVSVYPAGGGNVASPQTATSDAEFSVPPGTYGALSITGWGGLNCRGLSPCTQAALAGPGPKPVDSATALTVTAGGITEVTIQAPPPATLSGTPAVGGALTATLSEQMQNMVEYLVAAGNGGAVAYQWLRDGEAVPGGSSATYRPTVGDAGHVLAPRLSITGVMAAAISLGYGADTSPIVLAGSTVGRVATKAFVTITRPRITTAQRAALRVDVTNGNAFVSGTVVVRVGKLSRALTLHNGVARLRLPKLKKGRYVVRATYRGTTTYLPSSSPERRFVVMPVKRTRH
ncbi:hypothetical protein GCM10023350_35820 [Nocardioides endophyticus]|uniref:Bacterial Ig-like domain-containing protein n=2 Tax=Nocardioides endophyticus TaxID=1353775 RepID=A0ABP8Z6C7_9ACTN